MNHSFIMNRSINIPNSTLHHTANKQIMVSICSVHQPTIYIFLAIGLLITLSNGLVLLLIASRAKKLLKCSCSNFILTSLAVTDLLTGVATLVTSLTNLHVYEIACAVSKIHKIIFTCVYFMVQFCLLNSIFHLVMLATERLISIYTPLRHRVIVTKRRTFLLIVCTWFTSAAICPIEEYFVSGSQRIITAVTATKYVLFLIAPVGVILVEYVVMIFMIFRYARKRQLLSPTQYIMKRQKPCIIYLFMFTCFLLLVFPNFIVFLYDLVNSEKAFLRNHPVLMEFLGIFRLLPSLVNPFIYSFWKNDFQIEIKLLAKRLNTQRGSTTSGNGGGRSGGGGGRDLKMEERRGEKEEDEEHDETATTTLLENNITDTTSKV